MKKLIGDSGVYTIVLPHYIDMQNFRMNMFNNVIKYTHIKYDELVDKSIIPDPDRTIILTVDYKSWVVYSDYLSLIEYCNTISATSKRLIVIAQLPEASTFNLLTAGLELLDENNLYIMHSRAFHIPKSLRYISKAVLSVDDIKWTEDEEQMASYKKYKIIKSHDESFPFGKEITQSQII